jgi:hypothetical protein
MLTETEIEDLMRAATTEPGKENEFFRGLLDAKLHALAPLSDDHPRLRLIMFQRPDGLHFIPCFTSEWQAEEARGDTRRVSMLGRVLLESTRGAVFVINPNHEHCTIYPEEIEQLLTTGRIGLLTQETIQEGQTVLAGPPLQKPDWLINGLAALYAKLPFVVAAYLLGTVRPEISNETIWLVSLVVEPPYEERAVHATSAALQEPWAEAFSMVDLTTVTPDRTEDLLEGAMKFYERDPSLENTDIAPGIPRKMLQRTSQ